MEDDSNLDHKQASLIAHHTQKIHSNSAIFDSKQNLTVQELQSMEDHRHTEKEDSILKIETTLFHNPPFKDFERSESFDSKRSNTNKQQVPQFNHIDETNESKVDTHKRNNLKIKAFIGNQPSSLSGSQLSSLPSKDSNTPNRKVKFTVQPSLTSEKIIDRIKKQHQSANLTRKQDRESSKLSIQLDNEMLYNGGSFRTEERIGSYDPNLGSVINVLKRSSGRKQSQTVSMLIHQLPSRQDNRKSSNNTARSVKKSTMNMLPDEQNNNNLIIQQEQYQKEIDTKIRFIIDEHVDFDIDKQYRSKIYFPIYNVDVVIQKVQAAQAKRIEQLNDQKKPREFHRSRTSMALQKLRSATFRATLMNIQKTNKENDC